MDSNYKKAERAASVANGEVAIAYAILALVDAIRENTAKNEKLEAPSG